MVEASKISDNKFAVLIHVVECKAMVVVNTCHSACRVFGVLSAVPSYLYTSCGSNVLGEWRPSSCSST